MIGSLKDLQIMEQKMKMLLCLAAINNYQKTYWLKN